MIEGDKNFKEKSWDNTKLILPDNFPAKWQNYITSENLQSKGYIDLGELFKGFPAGFMIG